MGLYLSSLVQLRLMTLLREVRQELKDHRAKSSIFGRFPKIRGTFLEGLLVRGSS